MSANKFKVGDKVKVRKNLIEGRQYGCIYCNTDMAGLGLSGKTFTISVVDINAYQLEGYDFWWTDEMLELVEKNLDNKKKLGEITITLYETDCGYETNTKFSDNIHIDISGTRALVTTLRNVEKTIAKQVLSSMVDEDDDLLKSIFFDN